jgi:hypothetical protein
MLARRFLFTYAFLSFLTLTAGGLEDARGKLREDLLPDFRFGIEPVKFCDHYAASGLFQIGLRDVRINGTCAMQYAGEHLFKVSAEYLRQKLGFGYDSGHIHKWVDQYAVGGEGRLRLDWRCLEYLDLGVAYSHSPSKNLGRKLAKNDNYVVKRRIAGSDFISLEAGSSKRIYKGAISGNVFYDFVQFDQKYQHKKLITGPGAGLNVYHPFIGTSVLHLACEVRRPYLFLQARLDTKARIGSMLMTAGAFIESTKGFSSIPSSTLFGFEFFVDICKKPSRRIVPNVCPEISLVEQFAASPAVLRPQVIAMADQEKYLFCELAGLVQDSVTVQIPLGQVAILFSDYFTGTGPFVYVGANLPQGLALDPLSGMLTGFNNGETGGTIEGTVTAINYCKRAVLPVTFVISSL